MGWAPGTGKTSALRALIWQWRAWCAAEYIVDPEVLFGDQPSYLVSVLLHDHDERPSADEGEEPKHLWRLLILEDSGEFLTMDAKERTGQALSRFLNVVDGLIGQGLRLLVLVTSNEALGKLHPAVSRPGRCVNKIRFQPFTTMEANAWLARHGETRSMGDDITHLGGAICAVAWGRSGGEAPSRRLCSALEVACVFEVSMLIRLVIAMPRSRWT